jgi:hypothetical protein
VRVTLLAAGQSAASQAAPGVLGFLVVAGMGLILYFLFRSMTKHLRKVRLAAESTTAVPSGAGAGPGTARVSTGAEATDTAANRGDGPAS